MKYLLDTCVISEVIKPKPDKNVISWMGRNDHNNMYLSILTFGEIQKGIEKAIDITRKKKLSLWVENDLKERFINKIIGLDIKTVTRWGVLQGKAESIGKPMPAIDGLIAVSGLVNDCIVVTRNTRDMEQSTAELVNPWNSY